MAELSLVVPLFPLPDFVLFPGVTAGLHMFEPRYRALTADTLAADGRFVVAGLRPGWQADYDGKPPIYDVGSLCEMSQVVRLPDGRYNLLATGLERVRVTEDPESNGHLYRTVDATPFADDPCPEKTVLRAYESLRGAIRCLIMVLGEKARPLLGAVSADKSPEEATFAVAALLARTPLVRQALLEDLSVAARCERLTLLASELLAAASGPIEGELH
jgi:Lon protease-like protein